MSLLQGAAAIGPTGGSRKRGQMTDRAIEVTNLSYAYGGK